jgi:hypothetical protein
MQHSCLEFATLKRGAISLYILIMRNSSHACALTQVVRAADDDCDPGELRDAGDVRALSCREGARLRQKLPDTQGKIKGIVKQEQVSGHNLERFSVRFLSGFLKL